MITDTATWTLLEGEIVADSAYAHVVLGNFFADALTEGGPNMGSGTDVTYCLLDGVEVFPLDPDCHSVSVGERVPVREPTLHWTDDVVEVHWPMVDFEASVVDMAGRAVFPWRSSQQHAIRLAKPFAKGLYILRVKATHGRMSFKFVAQ